MNLNDEFYKKLDYDKIKINWNKNPIEMTLFMSFLTVKVTKVEKHLGSDTGWTKYENKEHKLIIDGGWVNQIEYLNRLQFGKNLHNPYQNYVSPFYMFEILTSKGKKFFLEYYKADIQNIKNTLDIEIEHLRSKLKEKITLKKEITNEIKKLYSN